MFNRVISFICLTLFVLSGISQESYYSVTFTDKNCNLSLSESECLSQKSINKRAKSNIEFTQQDLPICDDYIKSVIQSKFISLKNKLKWTNQITIRTNSSADLNRVSSLSYVKEVKLICSISNSRSNNNKFEIEESFLKDYGKAWTQNGMIGINQLHKDGFVGAGISIAVFDAGYRGVDTLFHFKKMWRDGRIIGMKDFVNNKDSVFYNSGHGTSVLSTMGVNTNAELVGSAPKANYFLVITEDAQSESLIEEYNWAEAAEFADSIGIDIINSSLGYTRFDDSTTNHTYDDLNGNTTVVTRAANMAYEKGILVVNSAGNYAQDGWYYMGAPSDGYGVLSIGAVGEEQTIAPFSSRGPNSAGRVKPDVCAMGWKTQVVIPIGSIVQSNGTSFSGPIIAGAVACLWEAYPEMSNEKIMQAVRESAHIYETPDDEYGYGIPNFPKAIEVLENVRFPETDNEDLYSNFLLFPNPAIYSTRLEFISGVANENITVSVISPSGTTVFKRAYSSIKGHNYIDIDCSNLNAGTYFVKLEIGNTIHQKGLVIQQAE
ncbi:MAG: S8 family serine peptidase [Salibacteraceae bacterium]